MAWLCARKPQIFKSDWEIQSVREVMQEINSWKQQETNKLTHTMNLTGVRTEHKQHNPLVQT